MNPLKVGISLCMIVKNEENKLSAAIDSVAKIVDEIIIVDTGSTDQTIAIAKKYADLLIEVPWEENFSLPRNLAIDEATQTWILILDADEIISAEDLTGIPKFLETVDSNIDGLFMKIVNQKNFFLSNEEELFPALRLFRNKPTHRFTGKIHEQIMSIPYERTQFTDFRIIHRGFSNPQKNLIRSKRNIQIIEQELAENPDNNFHKFNLAAEYLVAGDFIQALAAFEAIDLKNNEQSSWKSRAIKLQTYCYIQLGKFQNAKELIEKGKNELINFPDLYYLEAMLFIKQKKYSEALFPLYNCLAIGETANPRYITENGMGTYKIFFTLGSVYEALKEPKKAILCYRNTLYWNKYHLEAGIKLAQILLSEMTLEEIEKHLQFYYDLSNPRQCLILGKIFCELRLVELSKLYVQKALALGGPTDPAYNILGQCAFYQGNLRKMKYYSTKINEQQYQLSHSELAILELKEAVKILNAAEEKYPDSEAITKKKSGLSLLLEKLEAGDLS